MINKELLSQYLQIKELEPRFIQPIVITGPLEFGTPQHNLHRDELIKMYKTLFNMNNIYLLAKYHLAQLSNSVGLPYWDEDVWTDVTASEEIDTYLNSSLYVSTIAEAETTSGRRIVAFNANKKLSGYDLLEMIEQYSMIETQPGDVFYYVGDTFKLPHISKEDGSYLKGIGGLVRSEGISRIIRTEQDASRVIIFSTTTNPAMLKIWEEQVWTKFLIESNETFPRYRGYKIYQRTE